MKSIPLFAGVLTSTALLAAAPALAEHPEPQHHTVMAAPSAAEQQAQALRAAREVVNENPDDAAAHLKLAELLHKAGRNREAAKEYLTATGLQRDLYVAYHHLALICDDHSMLDEGIERLNQDKEKHPKDLLLRVALSELLEKRKDYRGAAKVLVELQYANAVPPKYVQRVEHRIHYLLSKSKELQLKQAEQAVATDEELDVLPAPLPDVSLRKMTASKIKDSKELKGVGRVPLLP